jgi:hypothetical protein
MVPSLFDALKAGKPMPKRNTTNSMKLYVGKSIHFTPEGTTHPFTVTARVKGGEGQVLRVRCTGGYATVSVDAEGKVVLTTPTGETLTSTRAITDTNWHDITLTSYYAQKRTLLYLDRTSAGELNVRLGEIKEVELGGSEREASELVFWRSAMTPDEITAHCNGKMLKSSLEIYVPLSDESPLENLAQSTNTVTVKEDATGINMTQPSSNGSRLSAQDSQLVYGLSGQSMNRTQKGVNIVGGKKILY